MWWSVCCVDARQSVGSSQIKVVKTKRIAVKHGLFFLKPLLIVLQILELDKMFHTKCLKIMSSTKYLYKWKVFLPQPMITSYCCVPTSYKLIICNCWSRSCIAKATILQFGPSVWSSWRRTGSFMRRYGTIRQWITKCFSFCFVSLSDVTWMIAAVVLFRLFCVIFNIGYKLSRLEWPQLYLYAPKGSFVWCLLFVSFLRFLRDSLLKVTLRTTCPSFKTHR